MHRLHLQAVDSRYATEEELHEAGLTRETMPESWVVMAHQARTLAIIRNTSAPIIINRATTGDGKTLAGLLAALTLNHRTFTMYPTNELVRDQMRAIPSVLADWGKDRWHPKVLTAQALDTLQTELLQVADYSRMETLHNLLSTRDHVLTNPDIFHLINQFAYKQYGTAHDHVLGALARRYRQFVFDEFHLFGAPEVTAVIIAILLLQNVTSTSPRFLFLSATPQPLLKDTFAPALGLEVAEVEGDYRHGESETPEGYRRILQSATLTLYAGRLEAWVQEHLEDVIMAFFRESGSGAKGVIIANSVATAHRIHAAIQSPCAAVGIKVGINTGLTPPPARNLDDVDLLVATSTIDVGVDFRINFLVYESADAAAHLQRLGRLGRHTTDAHGNGFQRFEAHALLPQWVIENIQNAFPDGHTVDRETYAATLRDHFPALQQFDSYARKWGGIQAAQVISGLQKPEIRTQYSEIVAVLNPLYDRLFPKYLSKYRRLHNDSQHATLDAIGTFRGGSPFTALVQDTSRDRQEVLSYSLFTLLRHAQLIDVSLDDMYAHAKRFGQDTRPLERAKPLAAYRLTGWLEKPRQIEIKYPHMLSTEQTETIIELNGFRISAPGVPELTSLNRALEKRTLTTFILLNRDVDTVRRRLRLGYQLELFSLRTENGTTGCVAFGRDALMLDSVFFRAKRLAGETPIFI